MSTIASVGAGILGFVILDGLWLGVVMASFYQRQFQGIGRFGSDGSFAPIWAAALPVYVLLGAGVALFALPRAASLAGAAAWGALLGLVVYGVYDLTNYSTLAGWPLVVTVADMLWGTFACAAVTAALFALSSR